MSEIDVNYGSGGSSCPYPPKKIIQVPVVIGKGEKQYLVVKEDCISPPSPPVFRIVDVEKEVIVTDAKLIPSVKYDSPERGGKPWCLSKVIINGYIDKNVIYKTIKDYTHDDVNGPLFQFTTRVPFSTFLEIETKEKIYPTDKVEILSAVVEGEKEELLDPNPAAKCAPDWAITYNKILEKILIRICAKVVRIEELKVESEY